MSHKEQKSCPCGGAGTNSGCQYKERNGRLMETKSFPFELEKINDAGEFKAFVSTHGNIDEGNDRFNYKSWARTLSIQPDRRFPFLHCHKMDQQTGTFVAQETERGLLVDGRLNLTTSDIGGGNRHVNVPKAYEVYGLMKGGDLRTFSIGWRPTKNGYKYVSVEGKTVREIYEAQLFEASTTPIPMNKMALLQGIKDFSNLSTASIIDYLRKHIDDAELWTEVFEIKGYDPEQYFHADPVPEIIPQGKNTPSTYDLFEKMVLEKYRRLT